MMNGQRESDGFIVPSKLPNKSEESEAEVMEGRNPTKRNTDQQNADRTLNRKEPAPSALDRVRKKAKKDKKMKFTALLHHVSRMRLATAFLSLKRKAAPGVDGVTWKQYRENLDKNIQDLHGRLHRGAYRAKPSKRATIDKEDGRKRLLGIAAIEDKIVQKAVAEVLNAIYEKDFLGFSYGFRPGRSPHQALDALVYGIKYRKVNYVLEADVQGFFDTISHEWLVKFIQHRIGDRRIIRLIQKWLSAGVMEEGRRIKVEEGTPQGATVSPLLANVYLHYVLDLWARQWRKKHANGDMIIVRWADDFVVGFQYHDDAKRFQEELRERLNKFSLELHPEKTRLLEFGRFAAERRQKCGKRRPETFNFLGFTHICARDRKGKFQLRRHTIRKRMHSKLKTLKKEIKRRMHLSISIQGKWLARILRGYMNYHAVPTNLKTVKSFHYQLVRHWKRALGKRSQRARMTWDRMRTVTDRWLPDVSVLHPWPEERFRMTRGRSRMS